MVLQDWLILVRVAMFDLFTSMSLLMSVVNGFYATNWYGEEWALNQTDIHHRLRDAVWQTIMPLSESIAMGFGVARVGHIWTVAEAIPFQGIFQGASVENGAQVPCHTSPMSYCTFHMASEDTGWLVPGHALLGRQVADASHPAVVAVDWQHDIANDRAAASALAWRAGGFPTSRCTITCQQCMHQTDIDLGWFLSGLLPETLRVVNLGCGKLDSGDPTHLLIRDHNGPVEGVCVDVDPDDLQEASNWLHTLGDRVDKFVVVEDAVGLANTSYYVSKVASEGGPITVMKVDIDSYDEAVVSNSLAMLRSAGKALPLVVVVEYDPKIPPPFRFRCLHVGQIEVPCPQPSLSYWIDLLSKYNYHLYKMNHLDLVFLSQPLAYAAAELDKVELPIDEFACYFQVPLHLPKVDIEEARLLLQLSISSIDIALDRIVGARASLTWTGTSSRRYMGAFEVYHPASEEQQKEQDTAREL